MQYAPGSRSHILFSRNAPEFSSPKPTNRSDSDSARRSQLRALRVLPDWESFLFTMPPLIEGLDHIICMSSVTRWPTFKMRNGVFTVWEANDLHRIIIREASDVSPQGDWWTPRFQIDGEGTRRALCVFESTELYHRCVLSQTNAAPGGGFQLTAVLNVANYNSSLDPNMLTMLAPHLATTIFFNAEHSLSAPARMTATNAP